MVSIPLLVSALTRSVILNRVRNLSALRSGANRESVRKDRSRVPGAKRALHVCCRHHTKYETGHGAQ